MKTFTQTKAILNLLFAVLLISVSFTAASQSSSELVFRNGSLLSGNALHTGAKYVFSNVTPGVDAVLTIAGRSDSNVVISNIDMSNTGFDKAFQPQIGRSGNTGNNANWWAEFNIAFFQSGHTTEAYQVTLPTVNATGLDIDGDGNALREYLQMNEVTSCSTALGSLLQTNLLATLSLPNLGGLLEYNYKFVGSKQNFNNIDTNAVSIMATNVFKNKNNITFRFGGQTGNSNSNSPSRMYSIWFKQFSLANIPTLPVQLISFNASLNTNNKVDLRWTTAAEVNFSHFVVEKSTDGKNFNDAGLVFATGGVATNSNYMLSDNLGTNPATVIYYRLRSVDLDGESDYSETRIIRISKAGAPAADILAYPNPASSTIRVTIPANWQNKKVVYEVYAANGQVMNRFQTASSSQTETLDISKLATGYYFVKVSCNGETAQQRIVKN
ncbi:MAG: T9SS type A sorting domain-containing protein [Chitinophagaceae bacterium]|nr:T9SS type A sorting domain-containing protein [Chitinophagaceae bacterium]